MNVPYTFISFSIQCPTPINILYTKNLTYVYYCVWGTSFQSSFRSVILGSPLRSSSAASSLLGEPHVWLAQHLQSFLRHSPKGDRMLRF